MKKFLAIICVLALTLSLTACGGKTPDSTDTPAAPDKVTGFMIRIPEYASISFYKGYEQKIAFRLPEPEIAKGYKTYSIPEMKPGMYGYVLRGTGCYEIYKSLILSEEDLAQGCYIYDDPGKSVVGGYQPTKTVITDPNKILENALPSDESMFPKYADVFTVPTFLNRKRSEGVLQVTTDTQMAEYIAESLKNTQNGYLYSAGVSAVNLLDMPLVIFTKTDLSAVKTYEEAAELFKDSPLPTVLYVGGIHGNEPAGRDGALAMIRALSGAYGDALTEKMNILVIPTQNPDGFKEYIRQAKATMKDLNRDHMKADNKEIQALHKVFYAFLPEVFIDGHEYSDTRATEAKQAAYADALVASGGTANTSGELLAEGIKILDAMGARLKENNLSVRYYHRSKSNYDAVNSQNPTTGRSYYSLTGALAFLVETRGIDFGLNYYERRVMTQFICTEAVLDYVRENSETVKAVVRAEREALIHRVETPGDKGAFVLETDRDAEEYPLTLPFFDQQTGERIQDITYTGYQTTVALQSVSLAGAYVIPASVPRITDILNVMDAHAITYEKVAPGTALSLSQIKNDAIGSYTETTDVTFADGAYVFPMNQLSSNILAFLMEPICPDALTYACSLYTMELVTATEDLLPIYRSAEVIPLGN